MKRKLVQWITLILSNANLPGFLEGRIYQGPLKSFCVPGLNCYSCPGAVGSCPIGALQAVIGSYQYGMSFYVVGLLLAFGVLFGRFVCGFLCPFGLIQELIHKIPVPKLKRTPKRLRYLKYGILGIFVLWMPLFVTNQVGMGDPAFCKYICPAGTLTGALPLIPLNPALQSALGWLFSWKLLVLFLVVLGCMFLYRFFCRYLCPLGAVYALFNRVSFYQLRRDEDKCIRCKACKRACPMEADPVDNPADPECIRCGVCVKVCSVGALQMGFGLQASSKPDSGHCKGCSRG